MTDSVRLIFSPTTLLMNFNNQVRFLKPQPTRHKALCTTPVHDNDSDSHMKKKETFDEFLAKLTVQ